MMNTFFKQFFGTKNDRELKRIRKMVAQINELEPTLTPMDDATLRQQTDLLKEKATNGVKLDDILAEAFATVREAGRRTMGMRHFDSQMIGGIVLHEGHIAEMRTGEGKTLVATLPAYLNALSGNGVHIVTVNDYLAERDANWMRPIYEFLGLSVGVVKSNQSREDKLEAYQADITYGTNNEFGFDYLRDNMALHKEEKVQKPLNFAIVDEVDSILIDEARTPLIISGPSEDKSKLYRQINDMLPKLIKASQQSDDNPFYELDEKNRQIELSEAGHEYAENMLLEHGLLKENDSLYAGHNLNLLHHLQAALKAHLLFQKNVHYITRNGQVVIIDEHTGRSLPGRRWSEGIHQAVEAKENLKIQNENQTLASTTFQNYFRIYNKLSGMTGTADTEAYEFRQIYNLDVVVIPTNKPMIRQDQEDVVYLNTQDKFNAIIADIKQIRESNAPTLVGTASIESSELLSDALKKANIEHQVLNAKFHEKEADIIAQAGRPGAVTIATNMAGRGTDILLGGSWQAEVDQLDEPTEAEIENIKEEWKTRHQQALEAGGLHIIGTERHESRRIDNQLRGRAGRQGDPGWTRFYLSLEDNLMRIFASDRVKNIMQTFGMEPGEAIEHKWVSKSIENAQKKVEGHNFDIRKNLLEYDDVANEQRTLIYKQRNDILNAGSVSDLVTQMREDVVYQTVDEFMPPNSIDDQWDIAGLEKELSVEFRTELPIAQWLEDDKTLQSKEVSERILEALLAAYQKKSENLPDPAIFDDFEKHILLQSLDRLWKEHLANMDFLRQGIHLRGYAQKNPKQEYKREAFLLFGEMLDFFKITSIQLLSALELRSEEEVKAIEAQQAEQERIQAELLAAAQLQTNSDTPNPASTDTAEYVKDVQTFTREGKKVGRNEPCPCGSGKKYKHCHGQIAPNA